MKVRADLDVCTGHARCQTIAPEIFATDDVEGKVVLLIEDIPPDLEKQALKGAKSCPERALTILDTETGAILWPPSAR